MASPDQLANAFLGRLDTLTAALLEAANIKPGESVVPAFLTATLTGASALAANGRATPIISNPGQTVILTQVRAWSTSHFSFQASLSWLSRSLLASAGHSAALFGPGTAPEPLVFARPLVMPPNATINLELQDLSAATNTIGLVFSGWTVASRSAAG